MQSGASHRHNVALVVSLLAVGLLLGIPCRLLAMLACMQHTDCMHAWKLEKDKIEQQTAVSKCYRT